MSANCSLYPDQPERCDIVIAVKRVTSSLSLIGCFFVIFMIWLFRKHKFFVQRLILYLSIAAFFDSISYLMGGLYKDGIPCEFQAWLMTYFDWSVLLWVLCITFNLYYNVIYMTKTDRFELYYHLLSWVFPFLPSCLPFIGDHYGPAGAWCWIDMNKPDGTVWRFAIWYVPLFVLIGLLVVTYIYITYKVKSQTQQWAGLYNPEDERKKELLKEDVKPLRAYPFIYLLTTFFPLVHRIYNSVTDGESFTLLILQVIFAPLVGMLNAIAFGMDRETLSRLSWTQIQYAFQQRCPSRRPLVREYVVHEQSGTTEVRPNDDSSWSSSGEEMPTSSPEQQQRQ